MPMMGKICSICKKEKNEHFTTELPIYIDLCSKFIDTNGEQASLNFTIPVEDGICWNCRSTVIYKGIRSKNDSYVTFLDKVLEAFTEMLIPEMTKYVNDLIKEGDCNGE